MSGTSRSRVTITLGDTGQVVRRDGGSKHSPFAGSPPIVGRKRPVRERLGYNVETSASINSKRLRIDGRTANAVDDTHLGKDDLRFKIMQKNLVKQSQSSKPNRVDLRNILSRPSQSSTRSITTRDSVPESKQRRPQYLEYMNTRQLPTGTRGVRHVLPTTRTVRHYVPESGAPDPRKQHVSGTQESGRTILESNDFGHRVPEQRASIPITGKGSTISNYSPWTSDGLRQRSPDEFLASSRGPIAPKRDETLQGKLALRAYDGASTSTYISKGALEISRPIGSSQLTKMTPSFGQMKPVAPVTAHPLPLPGSLTQRSPYRVDDQVTVDSFLRSLGLEKYAILFKAEEVDMYSLKSMVESDLAEMGIPMGPRKKILLSLQPRLRHQA